MFRPWWPSWSIRVFHVTLLPLIVGAPGAVAPTPIWIGLMPAASTLLILPIVASSTIVSPRNTRLALALTSRASFAGALPASYDHFQSTTGVSTWIGIGAPIFSVVAPLSVIVAFGVAVASPTSL